MQISWGKTPTWFKLINLFFLIPVIAWPLVFFGSIFMFDNPTNIFFTFLLFALMNAYPIYLVLLMYFNSRLFEKSKILAVCIPLVLSSIFIHQTINFFGGIDMVKTLIGQVLDEKIQESTNNNHKTLGYGYRSDSLNIYFSDQPLKMADVESFELISFMWAKDDNMIYFKGKPIHKIDSKSFEVLPNGYSKDRNYIYYDTSIVIKADIKTFKVAFGASNFASDSLHCYEEGSIINCKDMPVDTTYIIQKRK